jgi:opacity protein-like surface antigen
VVKTPEQHTTLAVTSGSSAIVLQDSGRVLHGNLSWHNASVIVWATLFFGIPVLASIDQGGVMDCRRVTCVGAVVYLLSVTPSWAQTERGFVRGFGGVTFGTAEVSSVFGGGGGVNVGPNVQIVGEIGRIQDVLPSELQDDLDFFITVLSLELGVPISVDVKAPAIYGLGGLRFNVPTAGRVRPFVEGQVGVANISFHVDAEVAGIDISQEVEDEADLDNESEVLLGLGGGLNLALTDTLGIDLGYRYGRIFTDDPAVNTNAVYAALHLRIP